MAWGYLPATQKKSVLLMKDTVGMREGGRAGEGEGGKWGEETVQLDNKDQ